MPRRLTYTCLECGGTMVLRRLRPDPHEPPVDRMVCDSCEYTEEPPMDIEAQDEGRPRLPGL